MPTDPNPAFPCSLTLTIPLPTHRLALTALRALQVDAELSPLVRRSLSLTSLTPTPDSAATTSGYNGFGGGAEGREGAEEDRVVLKTEYRATTNRMLRVAVNGFMESLAVVVGVMGELDADVLALERGEGA